MWVFWQKRIAAFVSVASCRAIPRLISFSIRAHIDIDSTELHERF
jgi:hypothetical protein